MGRFRKRVFAFGLSGALVVSTLAVGTSTASAQDDEQGPYTFRCVSGNDVLPEMSFMGRVTRSFFTSSAARASKANICVGEGSETPQSDDGQLACPAPSTSFGSGAELTWSPVPGLTLESSSPAAGGICLEVADGVFISRTCSYDSEACTAVGVNRARVTDKAWDRTRLEKVCRGGALVQAFDGFALRTDVCFEETSTAQGPRFTYTSCSFESGDEASCTQAKLPPLTFKPARRALRRVESTLLRISLTFGDDAPTGGTPGRPTTDPDPTTTTSPDTTMPTTTIVTTPPEPDCVDENGFSAPCP